MNITVSAPTKILVLVLVLAGVAFAASLSLLGRSASTAADNATQTVIHRTAAATAKPHTPAKPGAAAKPHTAAKPTSKTVATRVATAGPKPVQRGNLVYADLPAPLQWQLSQHTIVVVSLYNPDSNVDSIAVAEAHQGAIDAGAGFLLVSVLDNKVAGILTALLPGGGLLPAPGVLVYRAPGNIALRIDGFADRTSVAQAAQNALAGATGPTPTSAAAASSAAPASVTP